jgi:hypothetical protein
VFSYCWGAQPATCLRSTTFYSCCSKNRNIEIVLVFVGSWNEVDLMDLFLLVIRVNYFELGTCFYFVHSSLDTDADSTE